MDRIFVSIAEKTVDIDGEVYRCLDGMTLPDGLISLRWQPGVGKVPGYVEQDGDSHGFEGFEVFEPYIAAWKVGKGKAEIAAREKKLQDERDAAEAEKKLKDENDAAEAEQAAFEKVYAPYNEALIGLGRSDHEIIKAAEQMLLDAGKLPSDLVAQRADLRRAAKVEKKKLGL